MFGVHHGALEPTACVGWNRHQIRQSPTGLNCLENGWTVAIETIGHEVFKRQEALLGQRAHQRSSPLRLGLQAQLWWHLTLGSPEGVLLAQPRFGQKESLIDERLAVP
jgi:hypothetical protein